MKDVARAGNFEGWNPVCGVLGPALFGHDVYPEDVRRVEVAGFDEAEAQRDCDREEPVVEAKLEPAPAPLNELSKEKPGFEIAVVDEEGTVPERSVAA